MKSKALVFGLLGILSLILATAVVSAETSCPTGVLCGGNISSPLTVSHNSNAEGFNFYVNYTSYDSSAKLSFSGPTGMWASLPADFTSVTNSTSMPFQATLHIPNHVSGTIIPSITVTKSGTGSPVSTTITFPTVTITSDYSMSLANLRDLTASQGGRVNVSNTGNQYLNINLAASGDFNVLLSQSSISLNAGQSSVVDVTNSTLGDSLKFGTNTVTITANDSGGNAATKTISYSIDEHFCSLGYENGSGLEITSFDFSSSGDEDDVWKPLDVVTVKVEVENTLSTDIRDVVAQLGIFDSNGKNVVKDFDFISDGDEKIKLGKINDGDSEKATFQFKVPADFDKEGDYRIAVKAYSTNKGENNLCTDSSDDFSNDFYEDVSMERETDDGKLIAIDDIIVTPNKATLGDKVIVTFNVYNVGGEDQDKVKVNVVNTALGISIYQTIDDLAVGDGEKVEVALLVPQVKDGQYKISLTADYDYHSSTGDYLENTDNEWVANLEVFGSPVTTTTSSDFADVSASLESGGKAGENMVVSSSIKNIGNSTSTFVVSAKDYESWADLSSISNRLFTLAPGQSKEVKFDFNVSADASGEETFTVEITSGSLVEEREVAINIEGKNSSIFNRIASLVTGSSSLVWIIAAVNAILIILIIVVAWRLSR